VDEVVALAVLVSLPVASAAAKLFAWLAGTPSPTRPNTKIPKPTPQVLFMNKKLLFR
jgi:hypothetical protein